MAAKVNQATASQDITNWMAKLISENMDNIVVFVGVTVIGGLFWISFKLGFRLAITFWEEKVIKPQTNQDKKLNDISEKQDRKWAELNDKIAQLDREHSETKAILRGVAEQNKMMLNILTGNKNHD